MGIAASLTVAEATRRREKELHEFTAEQLILLDVVASNPRVLVDGPAGCGKTFMAVEATQRAVAQGKRVLVVVYNRLIEAELKALCVGADVYRIHELMAERAGVELPTNADHDWYTQTLPDLALDAALGSEPAYDYLVVDEAQDIAEPHYLEFLDLILVDGLVRSPLFVTGDFDHQSIYSGDSSTKAVMIGRLPNVTYLSLKSNVRSTPEVGRFVAQLVGDETLYAQHRRTDDDIVSVEIHEYSTPAEQDTLLAAAVELILSEPFKVRDIVILSPIRESAAAKATDQKLRDRLGANIEAPHGIRWGTIHGFKGMEAPAVILTDIDEANANLADLLYVGASRATDRLIVLRVSRQ
jgi:superfamily I DNA/RNA helicase